MSLLWMYSASPYIVLIPSVCVTVPLLLGVVLLHVKVLPHIGLHLLGVEVMIGIVVIEGPQLLTVFRLPTVLLILEVNPLESQMLM